MRERRRFSFLVCENTRTCRKLRKEDPLQQRARDRRCFEPPWILTYFEARYVDRSTDVANNFRIIVATIPSFAVPVRFGPERSAYPCASSCRCCFEVELASNAVAGATHDSTHPSPSWWALPFWLYFLSPNHALHHSRE